jgi:peptidoglycan/LPS O-acetylase OafA/YrhL
MFNYFVLTMKVDSSPALDLTQKVGLCIVTGLVFLPLTTPKPSSLKNFFNLRIFQIGGKLCFGCYLYHFVVIFMLEYKLPRIRNDFTEEVLEWVTVKSIFYTNILSAFYFLMIEKPVINIEDYFQKRGSIYQPKILKTEDIPQNSIELETKRFIEN